MNRRLWIGALGLCLGSAWSQAIAQQTVWRAAQRPTSPPPVVRAVSSASPRASLGKPTAVPRAVSSASSEPARFPPAYQTARPLHRASFEPGVEPIATVPPPGAIIASSNNVPTASTGVGEELYENGSGEFFAMDRRVVPTSGPMMPSPTVEHGDWKKIYAGGPPSTLEPGPLTLSTTDGPAMDDAPPTRFYARGEYLLWWIKNDPIPPLVTAGSIADGPLAGALGLPGTVILYNGSLDRDAFSGFRGTVGYYLDDCGENALEVSGFFLGSRSARFQADSNQYPVLARPFFDVNQQIQSVEQVAFPGLFTGRIVIEAPTEMWGAEINALCGWCCGCDWRVDAIGGVRFLNVRESLTITEDIQNAPGQPDPFNGTRQIVQDRFVTSNQFYGGQVGVEGRWQNGRWTVDGRAKIALGVTQQQLEIAGFQSFPPGTPNVSPLPGGLYALNSNIGKFSRGRFSVIPEVGISLGYYLTDYVRATIGYNFLYWSDIVRPGEQIDTQIDITRIPNFAVPPGTQPFPVPRPAVLFKSSDLWAQGLTAGLEFRY